MDIKDHWMKNFIFSSFCLEKNKYRLSLEINYGIMCFFQHSNYIINQIAHAFYQEQGFIS